MLNGASSSSFEALNLGSIGIEEFLTYINICAPQNTSNWYRYCSTFASYLPPPPSTSRIQTNRVTNMTNQFASWLKPLLRWLNLVFYLHFSWFNPIKPPVWMIKSHEIRRSPHFFRVAPRHSPRRPLLSSSSWPAV